MKCPACSRTMRKWGAGRFMRAKCIAVRPSWVKKIEKIHSRRI
jgi:hypothetical protein